MKAVTTFLTLLAFLFTLPGCSSRSRDSANTSGSDAPRAIDPMPPATGGHDHPDHGPHEGELVELGKEDFHIEMVHESEAVTFYVLDGAAANPVAIESSLLTISLRHDGQMKSFELTADPLPEDAEGRSSRFTSKDPQFVSWMDHEAEGAVTVQIQGKSYTGKIAHDHDHAGHDH